MNKINFSFLKLFLFFILAGCATTTPIQESAPAPEKVEKPSETESNAKEVKPGEASQIVLDKHFFVIHYDSKNRLAKYVEYNLKASDLKRSFVDRKGRPDPFHAEPELWKLKIPPVDKNDYARTGYDRGHLAPSGDFEWSEEANEATFTMANMVPQKPSLNRVAWRGLETEVRNWACAEEEVRIVTGPLIGKGADQLEVGVTIPQRFFKVVLDLTPPRKAIGFILDQSDSRFHAYKEKVVPISEIETSSGIQFFTDLPKDEKSRVIEKADLSEWHGENCKGSDQTTNFSKSLIPANGGVCKAGVLKAASIQGCCSHHGGVMGPKRHRACCTPNNEVICNDGSTSQSCRCIGN